jgi:hypothetical protein
MNDSYAALLQHLSKRLTEMCKVTKRTHLEKACAFALFVTCSEGRKGSAGATAGTTRDNEGRPLQRLASQANWQPWPTLQSDDVCTGKTEHGMSLQCFSLESYPHRGSTVPGFGCTRLKLS